MLGRARDNNQVALTVGATGWLTLSTGTFRRLRVQAV